MLTVAVFVCLFSACYSLTISPEGYYDTRYNHLDIERILNNKRLVNYYAACLLGRGPCTPQGVEFKRILPEALRTNCLRCTEKQKVTTYYAIRRLKKEFPKIWAELQAEWDPTGQYVSTFVNTVEKGSRSPEVTTPPPTQNGILRNRFGVENEISSSSISTDNVLQESTPSVAQTTQTTTTTTTVKTSTQKLVAGSTTNVPFRLRIAFRKPIDLFGSISDIGGKVIRTGARIADMVLSSVQATLGPATPRAD